MIKKLYEMPTIEIVSLETIQETMQSSSVSGIGSGSNLSDPTVIGGAWTDIFS